MPGHQKREIDMVGETQITFRSKVLMKKISLYFFSQNQVSKIIPIFNNFYHIHKTRVVAY